MNDEITDKINDIERDISNRQNKNSAWIWEDGFRAGQIARKEVFFNIRAWAKEKGLLCPGNEGNQWMKFLEEKEELYKEIFKNNTYYTGSNPIFVNKILPDFDKQATSLEFGDVIVTLTILAAQLGINIEDSIDAAWEKIKDRKGKTINGTFVKEE